MQLSSQQPSQSVKSFWQKQMPTMVGLGVLVVALLAGLIMFGTGTGVFSPRATPQTTPKQVKITNVGDKSFTVSFYTDEATVGFIKYGSSETDLKSQASDDRDQLTGSVGQFNLHHITVKGLKADADYFFSLGTGSGSVFDNNGVPFKIKTATDPGTPPPAAKTVYGSVLTPGGTPGDGSIVYLLAEGGNELSALVKSSGSWAISLANARAADKKSYLEITDSTQLTIFVQGTTLAQSVQTNAIVSEAQPLADLSLLVGGGASSVAANSSNATETSTASDSASVASSSASTLTSDEATGSLASDSASVASSSATTGLGGADKTASASSSAGTTSSSSASDSAKMTDGLVASNSAAIAAASPSAILNLEALAASPKMTAVVIEAPVMVGKAKPNVNVKIEIHSETVITQTVTADAQGNFELDVSQFKDLEPGEHTVTYSYIDPTTGLEVSKTQTFTVAMPDVGGSQQLALANPTPTTSAKSGSSKTTPTPTTAAYGSGNPYPITSPTEEAEVVDTSTRSAVVSTESGSYNTGTVGNTIALIGGGLFLMAVGWWSWWLAGLAKDEA